MADIVPYNHQGFGLDRWPQQRSDAREDIAAMGVHFTFAGDQLDFLLETVQRWFENRDEVTLIDAGATDKLQQGCIVMEWEGYDIDILFQDILRTDPMIIDYTIYERSEVYG
jgi:hypothetical protein